MYKLKIHQWISVDKKEYWLETNARRKEGLRGIFLIRRILDYKKIFDTDVERIRGIAFLKGILGSELS